MPLEIGVENHANPQWLDSLRWLNAGHYETRIGVGALRTDSRITEDGRFLCHLIPDAFSSDHRREAFRLLLAVARNKALNTRRLKNVGGGEYPFTRAGRPSVYARSRQLKVLRAAKEGVFGYEGVGRGGGCGPCAFNREQPEIFQELVPLCELVSELMREHEPDLWAKQADLVSSRRDLILGNSLWSQGVANLSFPMTAHRDRGNVRGSLSAMVVAGDFENGPLILPAYSLGIFVRPGDLLLFDGHELHGVGPFAGVRVTGVLYLKRDIFNCPCAPSGSA